MRGEPDRKRDQHDKYEILGRLHRLEQSLAARVIRLGPLAIRLAFAFVFLTFGAQKLLFHGETPVHEPVLAFVLALGAPSATLGAYALLFIGVYEVTLGVSFLGNWIRTAAALFVPHQLVGFLSLLVVPGIAFNDPVPLAYGEYGAFVLKNVVFVGAFLVLYALYVREGSETRGVDEPSLGPRRP